MEISEQKQKLIDAFVTEELEGEELAEFQQLMHDDASFANNAMEQAYTAATMESIGAHLKADKPEINKGSVKQLWIRAASVAAVIVLFLVMGKQIKQLKNKANVVIVETDTVYMPKDEYFKLPNKISTLQYAQNTKMDKLVDLSAHSMRSGDSDICLPHHNADFQMGNKVDFELSQFNPGTYRLVLLGFHQQITAIDTLYNQIVKISDANKIAYKWQPKISGTYYWMIYLQDKPDPYLVRRFTIK